MSDLWTMIWKEAKELIFQAGWARLIRALIAIGAMGGALRWRAGLPWLELSLPVLLILLWVPFIYSFCFIGDAVGGGRERHRPGALLASRMPDRASLVGKGIVTVGYAWALALVCLLLGPVVVNLSAGTGPGSWVFYHPLELFLEAVVLSLLVSLLTVSAGVLISLHAATVRQA